VNPSARFLPILFLLVAACGDDPSATPPPSEHLLASDLPDAVSVLEAKGKPIGTTWTVVGRVRSLSKGVIALVDDREDYCGRGDDPMERCPTPWDYCCEDPDKIAESTLVVRALSRDGTPVARDRMGLRPLDLVALRGVWAEEKDGSRVLVAREGWYRRERPAVGDHVRFE
jgi:hypothetical protein